MQLYENSRLFRYIASFRSCTPICNIRCNSRQEAEPASPLCPLIVFTGGEVCFRSALSFFAFAADVSPKPDLKWGTRPQRDAKASLRSRSRLCSGRFPQTPFFTLLRVERRKTTGLKIVSERSKRQRTMGCRG